MDLLLFYSLNANRDDYDGGTSKACYSHEAQQSLAEYAELHHEYKKLNKIIKEGKGDSQCETRRNEISKELASLAPHVQQVS